MRKADEEIRQWIGKTLSQAGFVPRYTYRERPNPRGEKEREIASVLIRERSCKRVVLFL